MYIQKVFNKKILDVIIKSNMKIVNFLNVIFNLNDDTYKPYKKQTKLHNIMNKIWRVADTTSRKVCKNQKEPKKHKGNIIWFNPSNSKIMKTNIGKYFFHLTKEHFPPEHKFSKTFDRNTLELSYSCMPNLKRLINNHNQNILRDKLQST